MREVRLQECPSLGKLLYDGQRNQDVCMQAMRDKVFHNGRLKEPLSTLPRHIAYKNRVEHTPHGKNPVWNPGPFPHRQKKKHSRQ